MGVLDLLGVLAIGLLGALSVDGLQAHTPEGRVGWALQILGLSEMPFQRQAVVIGASAVGLLVGRTLLSIFFTRRILFFLSRRGAKISADLISRLLSQPLLAVQARTTQETIFAVTGGVEIITLQILATAVVLASDLSLLVIMGFGLVIVDPVTATGTLLAYLLVGYFLYRLLHVRAGKLGLASSSLSIRTNEKIVEVFSSYRESMVRNRREYYARQIAELRFELADTLAERNFMPYISKYVIETTVILGSLLIGFAQFFLQDARHAVATLAIFLAAGTRIAPAVLRVQQGSITIRGGLGAASVTLDLIDSLRDVPLPVIVSDEIDLRHDGFKPSVHVVNAILTFPNTVTPALDNISVSLPEGAVIAIVGPSGAGKTTFLDAVLGVLSLDEGSVLISGLPPLLAIAKWPGAISYVPQDVIITAGTVRENIGLGYPPEFASDEMIKRALKFAQLEQYIADLPEGINTEVGERGAKISGGQRQRLGIARAMFTNPKLLILDEATSSLDGESEANIADAILALRGSITVVMVAHRLSTVRDADLILYMSEGKILSLGTFSEIRAKVPDFDHQAKLMGL
jgi:ABC-type multidrug transport system fused ATPase/permease subunit